jgi:Flp pilus assembly protein TadB
MEVVHRSRTASAELITSAPERPDADYRRRRKRYTVMMGLRIVCLLGAVLTYSISLWFALALIVGGAALPWCAVLIANDGPPRKRRPPVPAAVPVVQARQLSGTDPERIVEG